MEHHNTTETERHNGPRHTDEIVQDFIDKYEEIANGGGPSKEQSMSDLELLKGFS